MKLYRQPGHMLIVPRRFFRQASGWGYRNARSFMVDKVDSFEEWLVPRRSQIQTALLDLYTIIRNRKKRAAAIFQFLWMCRLLTAAGFSLWRAVFLARQPTVPLSYSEMETYLRTVINDNTITYRDDKNAWSYFFYINTARASLLEVYHLVPATVSVPNRADRLSQLELLTFFGPGQPRWDTLYVAFTECVGFLRELGHDPD